MSKLNKWVKSALLLLAFCVVICAVDAFVAMSISGQAASGLPPVASALSAAIEALWGCTSSAPYMTISSGLPGCSASSAATQRGIDAVVAGGLSTGASDNASTWLSFLQTNCQSSACDVHIPCGTYKVSSVTVPVTNGTYSSATISGDGKATYTGKNCVEFDVTSPGGWGLWWDNTTTGAGNNGGPTLRNISFRDVTTASQCNTAYGSSSVANHTTIPGGCAAGGVRFTQINYGALIDVATYGFVGILNWDGANDGGGTGTVSVTNGSNSVSCSTCTFTSAMIFGQLWVNGEPQEICNISGSTATLCSNWEFPTYTGTNWNVDYNGVGFMWDGSSISGCSSSLECFSQYWDVRDPYAYSDRLSFDFVGDNTTACWSGTSRFFITGGATNGEHVGDNIGLWIGKCGDTVNYEVAQNNVAIHAVIEDGHANSIRGVFENSTQTAAITPVYTCNSGAPTKSCTKGVLMNCETSGECKNNTVVDGYILGVGNGIEINNESVVNGFHIANVRMDTNSANYVWDDGKSCKTQTSTDIDQPDCRATQSTVWNVNNSTMTFTNTGPSGSCTVGDEWHNQSGAVGSIFYICGPSNTWHDIY